MISLRIKRREEKAEGKGERRKNDSKDVISNDTRNRTIAYRGITDYR